MKKSDAYSSYTLSLHQVLLLFCAFSCLLCMVRVVMTGERSFIFMMWNLFLALIPYTVSRYLYMRSQHGRFNSILLLATWLLFIPNSFYMLTDLFHLSRFDDVPRWFDLLLLLSFALNGLLLGIVSLRKVELFLEKIRGKQFSIYFVIAAMFLSALGVYLGRYLRFNSWDILTQPAKLFTELYNLLVNPLENLMEWGMVMSYTIFMTLIYVTVRKLAENLYSSANKSNI